jgi:hypothetical protein
VPLVERGGAQNSLSQALCIKRGLIPLSFYTVDAFLGFAAAFVERKQIYMSLF